MMATSEPAVMTISYRTKTLLFIWQTMPFKSIVKGMANMKMGTNLVITIFRSIWTTLKRKRKTLFKKSAHNSKKLLLTLSKPATIFLDNGMDYQLSRSLDLTSWSTKISNPGLFKLTLTHATKLPQPPFKESFQEWWTTLLNSVLTSYFRPLWTGKTLKSTSCLTKLQTTFLSSFLMRQKGQALELWKTMISSCRWEKLTKITRFTMSQKKKETGKA